MSLCCENINSLKGKVDKLSFSEGLLSEMGLFVISGPTGAGKSTLLDVICVALYGKTPRLLQQTDHLMSKTTGYCWAEVELEVNGIHYSSRWELHRSRKKVDGAMQGSKMFLSQKNETGQYEIIEEKTSKVPDAVQKITGLDFQRFCRSMLLAQGECDAFLKGKDNERAELLEKMTGTEIYRDLSILAFERAKQTKLTWEQHEQWRKQHLEHKTSRELKVLENEDQETHKIKKNYQQNLSELEINFADLKRAQERHRDYVSLQKQHELWKKSEVSSERTRWLQWLKIEPLEEDVLKLNQLKEDLKHKQVEFDNTKSKLLQLEQQQSDTLQALQQKSELFKGLKKEHDILEQLYPKVIELNEKDKHIQTQLSDCRQQLQTIQRTIESQKSLFIEKKNEHENLKREQEKLEAYFNDHGSAELQRNYIGELKVLMDDQKDLKVKIDHSKEKLGQLELQYKRNQVESEVIGQEEVSLKKKNSQIDEQITQLESQEKGLSKTIIYERDLSEIIKDIEEYDLVYEKFKTYQKEHKELEKDLAECEVKLKQVELAKKEQDQLLQRESLSEYRHDLKEGEECPLCGALDHPYVKNGMNEVHENQYHQCHEEYLSTMRLFNQLEERAKLSKIKVQECLLNSDELSRKLSCLEQELKVLLEQPEDRKAFVEKLRVEQSLEKEHANYRNELLTKQSEKLSLSSDLNKLQVNKEHLLSEGKAIELSREHLKTNLENIQNQERAFQNKVDEKCFILRLNSKKRDELSANLDHFSRQLEKFDREFSDNKKLEADHEALLMELSTKIQELDKQSNSFSDRVKQLEIEASEVKANKYSLHPEFDNYLDLYENSRKKVQDSRENLVQNEKLKLELDVKLIQVKEGYQQLHDTLPQLIERVNQESEKLSIEIKKIDDLENDDELLSLIKQKKEFKELEPWNREHELKGHQISLDLKSLNDAQNEVNEDELIRCDQKLKELKTQLEQVEQKLGAISREKVQEQEWQKQYESQVVKSEKLERDFIEWDQLKKLIGSADGGAFRKIAQSITLKHLLELANRHLKTILDRYQLVSDSEKEMGIILKDRYQAMSARPLETLSGGERFMISLALALALSDISRRHQAIESLFIDEGFGSLDVHALDRVLEALDKIRQMGRSIGIISHIEALKERIPAQIHVEPLHGGSSRVKVVGA